MRLMAYSKDIIGYAIILACILFFVSFPYMMYLFVCGQYTLVSVGIGVFWALYAILLMYLGFRFTRDEFLFINFLLGYIVVASTTWAAVIWFVDPSQLITDMPQLTEFPLIFIIISISIVIGIHYWLYERNLNR